MSDRKSTEWAKYALISYWLLLVLATHVPAQGTQLTASLGDKTVHFAAFALLAVLCGLYFVGRKSWKMSQWAVLIAVLVTYAAVDEITQIPVPGRFGDKFDWIADVSGILTGVGLYVLVQTRYRRTQLGRVAGP